MIRDGYWAALGGKQNLQMIEAHGTELLKDVHHVNHCFDYIRQSIMCAGDMSIEGVAPPETDNEKPHINGYGNRHECKSYVSSLQSTTYHEYFTYSTPGSLKGLDGCKGTSTGTLE